MHLTFIRLTRAFAATAAFALVSTFALVATHPAQAQGTVSPNGYYTYTLSDVSFNDYPGGGTATGYFDYDPTTGSIGSYSITTSYYDDKQNGVVYGDTYTNANGAGFSDDTAFFEFETDNDQSSLYLQGASLVDGSGPYDLSFTQETAFNPDNDPYSRQGSTGTISGAPAASAVPELSPAVAIGLLSALGCGALGLAGVKRRRMSRGAA